MKSLKLIIPVAIMVIGVVMYACNKKLDIQPQGALLASNVYNNSGVQGLLIGAYKLLSGEDVPAPGLAYGSAGSNWVYGSIAADDSYKGSTPSDQPDATAIMSWALSQGQTTQYLEEKWSVLFNGVQRANDVIRAVRLSTGISPADTVEYVAEARFLRGFYHLDGKKMWNNFPFVDEGKTLLDQIIANGTTAGGVHYSLVPNYESNFNPAQKNGPESVFACQASVNDGSSTANDGGNGDMGDVLNFPYGQGPIGCCGFNNPSWNLVQAYKTDAGGLPLLDGSYNSKPLVSDTSNAWAGTVDPRLDWVAARPGKPYLDWGLEADSWIRDPNSDGRFLPKKNAYAKSQQGSLSSTATVFWGATQIDANNIDLCRFADVLLWAAECEVEIGSLDQAQTYVNMVRSRAANKSGWVYLNAAYNASSSTYSPQTTPADNYAVNPYPAATFTAKGQAYARSAVQMERRLELAMEGHRFFDLSRWDNGTGSMAATLNNYVSVEKTRYSFYYVVNTAVFTKGVNEYFAIPQIEIDAENASGKPNLKQNPGYN
jgi:hypothetical protein